MKAENIKFKNIDEYIETFPKNIQIILNEIRKVILLAAPNAEEKISYNMPTFFLNRNLVHFAGYKNHVGFYPTPSGIVNFAEELKSYKTSKGAIQFPIDKPLPVKTITKIVKFRVKENSSKPNKNKQ
ncbi:MAG: DUF1801 domain-containing protein [Ignavibacteriales bacterium]|nr:DUF1801 domain-containing protein [Ignavibacteriales bacterium]